MDPLKTIGKILEEQQPRDAIHIAVACVEAAAGLEPGDHVKLNAQGRAEYSSPVYGVGIVDPFLPGSVRVGQKFWLFLYPNTVTSLRHDWTHPAFEAAQDTRTSGEISRSVQWMRCWAARELADEYFDWCGEAHLLDEKQKDQLYDYAIRIGESNCAGRCMNARDTIDGEWWTHWEAITGRKGNRDEYISCGC